MKKWLIGLACAFVGATMAMGQYTVDFEGEGETKTAYASATVSLSGKNWDMTDALIGTDTADWKNGVRSARMRGYGTSAMTMLEDIAEGVGTISFSYRRYGTAAQVDWKVEYSTDGGTSWTQAGDAFTAPASDDVQTFSAEINSGGNTRIRIKRATESGSVNRQLNIDDITMTAGGPAVFGVNLDKADGFEVEEGSSDTITATAANGTTPYAYEWSSTLGATYYTAAANVFTILATAPAGDYSATVTATDATMAEAEKTVTFSVVVPAPKYAITIAPAANGTVTTTPATEAEEGQTVTINATPSQGFAVASRTVTAADLSDVPVTGNTFTMPAQAVTVTVTFQESSASGELIISQYYEGTSNNKWIEIYNPGSSSIDLSAGNYRVGQFSNTNREGWKISTPTDLNVPLSGTIAAYGTYLVAHSTASNPAYATANQTASWGFNGDDSVVIFTGGTYELANLVDVFGATNTFAADKSFVRKTTVTSGVATDFNADEWDQFTLAAVDSAAESTNERLGYHSTGPAEFSVSFNKANGFEVTEGIGDAIVATAANGTAPYTYGWSSTLGGTHYTTLEGTFTILATAPIGSYTTTVVATDSGVPAQGVTNAIAFSVAAPAPKYAITITTNTPAQGTVTTTPATEAEAGQTVTVNATPADGFAVDTIVVNGGAVAVNGTTFTMPAGAAAVAVTFKVYDGPDVLLDFETDTTLGGSSYAAGTYDVNGVSCQSDSVLRGSLANDRKNGGYSGRFRHMETNSAFLATAGALAQPIGKITFWYANYGSDTSVKFKVQVSDDGATWTDVGAAEYDPDSTNLVEGVIDSIPANMTYVKFVTTGGTSGQRLNIDDIGIFYGTSGPSLSYTGATTITLGQTFNLVFTLNGATASGWQYTFESASREQITSGNVNTFTYTPSHTGTYYLAMTALDEAVEPIATRELTLTVNPSGGGTNAEVTITGDLTGTVGVQMDLTIALLNGTASDWGIALTDPDSAAVFAYNWNAETGAFSFTPTKEGTYVLAATAIDEGLSPIATKSVNLAVGGSVAQPEIEIVLVKDGTGDFQFAVPTGYALARVEGSTPSQFAANAWTTLTQGVDYTVSGTTVRILTSATDGRMVRIVMTATR